MMCDGRVFAENLPRTKNKNVNSVNELIKTTVSSRLFLVNNNRKIFNIFYGEGRDNIKNTCKRKNQEL
ncbi:hypothetical protein RB195_000201 [Necator americanus]|uniref:Uncharacterized protein n=1 Tax=Necator americanus TaxID=51031 RepID=A0ABR1D8M2_NECAM